MRRFLLTLVREGYAGTDGKYFRLLPKILELGYSAMSSMDIWEVAQPIMTDLSERLEESCFAAVLNGDSVIYVARATSNRVVTIGINIGSRVQAHAVSTGRVLLASLSDEKLDDTLRDLKMTKFTHNTTLSKVKLRGEIEQVRSQGWSIVDQELEVGLRSISVPIRDRSGAIVAALNVCCPAARVSPEQMRTRILVDLLEASNQITRALQG